MTQSQYLSDVKHSLQQLGYQPYIAQSGQLYRVYLGPFKNDNDADKVLYTVRKHVSKDAYKVLLSIPQYKSISAPKSKNITINTPQVQQKTHIYTSVNNIRTTNKFFMGLTTGGGIFNIQKSGADIVGSLKSSGINYGIEGGYYLTDNTFVTIDYQRINLDDIIFDNIFSTLNYQFDGMFSISPYFGFLGGYNMMTWKNPPSNYAKAVSSSIFLGFQAGSEMALRDDISLYLAYQYFGIDYRTSIEIGTDTEEIKHFNEQNMLFGVKYYFGTNPHQKR